MFHCGIYAACTESPLYILTNSYNHKNSPNLSFASVVVSLTINNNYNTFVIFIRIRICTRIILSDCYQRLHWSAEKIRDPLRRGNNGAKGEGGGGESGVEVNRPLWNYAIVPAANSLSHGHL